MVDLHIHILPALDDGPADVEGSLALAEVVALGGTRTVVATPHLREDHPRVRPQELVPRAAALGRRLAERGIPVTVLPGAEVALSCAEGLSTADLRAATLGANGADLLLETPYGELGTDFEPRVRELAARGFRLTLAHPERNATLQRDPERLERLCGEGVLVQLTARSLAMRRSAAGRLAELALRRGWAHVLASDAHAVDRRPPDLHSAVLRTAERLPGSARQLRWMTHDAPRAIVEGRELPARPAGEPGRRRLRLGRR